jgi:ATPase subunit of ABC transporter with duplicated ATPase domains
VIAAPGVAKAFARRPVLRDVELEPVSPGLVRVEGANGAGKSTLLLRLTWLAVALARRAGAAARAVGRRGGTPPRPRGVTAGDVVAASAVVAAPLFALAPCALAVAVTALAATALKRIP